LARASTGRRNVGAEVLTGWAKASTVPIMRDARDYNGLRAARLAAGLSVAELAERCRVTQSAVFHWQLSRFRPGGPSRLALAAAFGVDPETVDGWFQGSAERAA